MRPPWARDEEEYIVDDERVIRLACEATGVYDKPYWYSGEVPDHVWAMAEAEGDHQPEGRGILVEVDR